VSRTVWETPEPLVDFPAGEAVISDDPCPRCDADDPDQDCPRCLGSGRVHDYRYALNRRWAYDGPIMTWVGLNPSTADATVNDPSVRRMMGFARREGCRGICVLNAFGLRATDPAELARHPDPVGPENDRWLSGLTAETVDGPVVAAWGAHRFAAARVAVVHDLLTRVPLVCLGTTKEGAPRHPLYVRGDTALVPLPPI
jgi:hypothetical protein